MPKFDMESPSRCKVIDIRNYLISKRQPERILGLAKMASDDFMAPYFNQARRGQGNGLFCIRVYDEVGTAHAFMSGVIYEKKTGNPDKARMEHQMELANELTVVYDKAREIVKNPADIYTLRQGHMSFLAVKCQEGMLMAGWFDTKSKTSANGIHMLAFTLYTLGLLNQQDADLKEATINHLPFAEGVSGDFNVEAVQKALVALATTYGIEKR